MKRNVCLLGLMFAVGMAICWPPSGTKGTRPTAGNNKEGSAVVNASLTAPRTTIGSLLGGTSPSTEAANAAARKQVAQNYGKLPLSFEPNAGEVNGDVKFLSRGNGYALFLTADQAVLAMSKPGKSAPALKGTQHGGLQARHATPPAENSVLRMSLLSANRNARVVGMSELPGKTNYFIGNDARKWRTNVPTYAQVKYVDVYPGVDLVYYGNQGGQLEYDFVVAPGADPAAIQLGVQTDRQRASQHASALRLAPNGDVLVTTYGNEVRFHKPVVYQLGSTGSAASRTNVSSHYVLTASNGVSFALGAYDRSRPLFIDPVLTYSTYLGGSGYGGFYDGGEAIAVDSNNNAYVTGYADSLDFPTHPANQNFNTTGGTANSAGLVANAQNAFVSKLDPTGHTLLFSTYLGGSGYDGGQGIAVDASGNMYVAGYTSSVDFPTYLAYQSTLNGYQNAFVTEISSSGSNLLYSTYLGGSASDAALGIALDASGDAYVTGFTQSSNFPTASAYQSIMTGAQNAFVAKVAAGGGLTFSTYLGGTGFDAGNGIVVVPTGANAGVYVAGYTSSSNFPTTAGALQTHLNYASATCSYSTNLQNGFVTKLNLAGSALSYSTFLGGECYDGANAIAVDSSGNAYVTGSTTSSHFPIPAGQTFNNWGYPGGPDFVGKVNSGLACSSSGCTNAFVSELNPAGTGLVLSTYLGGSGYDVGNAIAVDTLGNMYIVGNTASSDFPVNPTPFQLGVFPTSGIQATFGGCEVPPATCNPANLDTGDAFVAEISSVSNTTALMFSTYMGGSLNDAGLGVALDSSGDVYLTGYTQSYTSASPALTGFPITPTDNLNNQTNPTPYQSTPGFSPGSNGYNAFVAQIGAAPYAYVYPSSQDGGSLYVGTGTVAGDVVFTVENLGNAALIFDNQIKPSNVAVNPNDFILDYGYSGAYPLCSTSPGVFINNYPVGNPYPNALMPGTKCVIAAYFNPSLLGAESTQFEIDDNALPGVYTANDPAQYVNLTGTGDPDPTYIAISAPAITYNANGSVTVTVTSVPGAGTPAGDVILNGVSRTLSAGAYTFTSSDIPALASPNAGSVSLSASYAAQGVFAASTETGSLTVNAKPITATLSASSKTYDGTTTEPNANMSCTLNGVVAGDTVTCTPSSGTFNTSQVATANTVTATVTIGGTSAGNYTLGAVGTSTTSTSETASASITTAAITAKLTAANKVYDTTNTEPNGNMSCSLTGVLAGDSGSVSCAATSGAFNSSQVASASSVTATVTISGGEAGNYTLGAAGSTLPSTSATAAANITAVPLSIKASNGSYTYGGTVPTITASYTGFVGGETYSNLTTQPTCSTTALTGSPVANSPYTSSCSGAVDTNYIISYVAGSVTENAAPLTITASNGSYTYGGTVPAITASYLGFVNSDTSASLTTQPTCSTTAMSLSPVVNSPYSSSCSGAADTNYIISYAAGSVTESAAPLTITASGTTSTYGTTPTVTASYLGFVGGQNSGVLTPGPTCTTTVTNTTSPGTYGTANTCSGAVDTNYSISYVAGSAMVNPAPLTVTASSTTSTYGTTPTVTASYLGFVNGQNASVLAPAPTCTSTVTNTTSPGTYGTANTCSGAVDANYSISYVAGSAMVNPAPLTITASATLSTYGTTPTLPIAGYSGFVNGEGPSNLTPQPSCATTITNTTPVGTYNGASTCSGAVDTNYTISYVAGPGVVNPAPLTVTASSTTSTYGTAPTVTASYLGFVNGQNAGVLAPGPTCTSTVTNTTSPGTYNGANTCAGAVDANYSISYVAGSAMVNPAPLTVTASSTSTTYGTTPTVTASYLGFVNGQSASNLTSAPTCTSTVSNTTSPGTYNGANTCAGAVDTNYTISYVAGSAMVNPAALTVTASSTTSTYGTTPTVTASYLGFVNGQNAGSLTTPPSCATTVSNTTSPGTYSGANTCSGAVDTNYNIGYVAGSATVDPAALTITASNTTSTYGTTPTVTASYLGFVNGQNAGSLATAPSCTTTVSNTTTPGTYNGANTCSGAVDANYTISYVAGSATVNPAALTVTASNTTSTYGTAPSVTASYSGFVNGQNAGSLGTAPSCTTTVSNTTTPGTYNGANTCSGAVDANYTISYVAGSATVNPAALTVTASNTTSTYGTAPSVTASYSGFVNGQNAGSLTTPPSCSSTVTATTAPGTYGTANTCSGAVDANYSISYVTGSAQVNAAALTITASNTTTTYGTAPSVTASYSGFVNGQNAGSLSTAPTCSSTVTATTAPGTYGTANTCSGAVDANYSISYVAGSATVDAATLTITASNTTTTYGTAPSVTASYSGFVNGQNAGSLTTPPSCTSTVTATTAPGTYSTANTCAGAVDANYTISYVAGSATVDAATLTITASNTTTTYGTAPSVTASYSGFVNGQGAGSLTTPPSCTSTVTATTAPGTYGTANTCSGAVDANYSISYVAGSATVDAAALTITASNSTMTYGGTPPAVTASYGGFVNGQNSGSLTTPPTCTTTATSSTPVGTDSGANTCSGASDPNYTISYVPGNVTVSAEPVTVTASNTSMTYGGTAPTPTASYSYGVVVNSATPPTGLTGVTCSTTATSSTPVGTDSGANTCGGGSGSNYSISYVAGSVTVSAEPVTVTASNTSMTYGGTAPTPTALYSYGVVTNSATPPAGLTGVTCSTTATSSTPVGTDSGANSCTGGTGSNYSISYATGNVTVSAESVTVTASNTSMTYGGTAPTPTAEYTYGSQVNVATPPTGLTGVTCSTTATSSTPVGTDSGANSCTGGTGSNYSISYATGNVTVSAEPVTVTASNTSMTYGGTAPTPTASYTYGSQVNVATPPTGLTGVTCSTTATSSTPVGTDSGANTCSGGTGSNYSISYVAGNVSVSAEPVTVTASNTSMTYGGTAPTPTASYTYGSQVNVATPPAGLTGVTCSTTATSSTPVGTDSGANSCTGGTGSNYSISYATGNVTVSAESVTVTASNTSMTYGGTAPTPTAEYTYGSQVNVATPPTGFSGVTCTTTATNTTPAGTDTGANTCSGGSGSNYTVSGYVAGNVTVSPASQTISFTNPGTQTYGETSFSLTASATSGLPVTFTSTTPSACTVVGSTVTIVGAGTCTITASQAGNSNYAAATPVSDSFTVGAASLNILAGGGTFTYGSTPPAITATYTGFVNGDTVNSLTTKPTCTTTASATTAPGTYASNCAGAVDANYTITYTPGSVTENPAPLTITASAGSMTYGGTPPTVTASYSGFVNSQSAGSLTTQPTCTTSATSATSAGTDAGADTCAGAVDANYAITYAPGNVTVNPAPLVITASSATMVAGSTPPAITASYSAFVNGQSASNLTTQPTCSTTVTSGSPVGTYTGADTCAGAVDSNYSITYVAGTMTVTSSTSTGAPIASLSTGCISFGGVQVNSNCANQPEVLTNIGNANLTINSIAISGSSDFTETNNCPASLAPGASCTITVSFMPTTVGPETGTLTITDNSNNVTNATQTVGLSGAGQSQIQCNFNGTAISGGNWVWFNSVFSPKNIPNTGSVTYSVTNSVVTFTANGNTFTVPLPNSLITLSSSITVATTTFDSVNNRWITLAPLTGLSGNIFLNAGAYQVPAGGLPGGIQNVKWNCSFTTDTQGATLQWQWGAACYTNLTCNYNQLCVKPCDDNQRSQYQCSDHAGTCEGNNSSNQCWKNCVTGGCTGGGGSNCTGSYSGTGSCNPTHCALATVVNCTTFGTQTIGTNSAAQAVTIVNNSSTAITNFTFAVTGEFAIASNTCGTSLAAGASCVVNVTFDPTATGTQTGTLTITDSACNSPQVVNLAGNLTVSTATAPGPIASLTPTCMNFTGLIQSDCWQWNQQPGVAQVATLTNIGTGILNIASIQLTGAQAFDFSETNTCPSALQAGASCTISITFNPTTVGPSSASLVITDNSNDITGSTQSITLNGAGQTQLQGNFNEGYIQGVNYVWFSGSLSPQNISNNQTTNFFMTNGVVTFTQNNQNVAVAIPDCIVTFSPNVTTATTTWDSVNNRWVTVAPTSGFNGNTFLSAVAYQSPASGYPGSISNVAWTAAFSTDTPGASLNWQWAAAPYSQLPTNTDNYNNQWCNYSGCNVKPVDGNHCNQWNDNENAGTPEGCQSYCYKGGTCDGYSNHTGDYCQPGGPTCKLGPVCLPTCTYVATTPCNTTCPVVPITYCNKNSVPICITKVQCTGDYQNTNNVCNVTLQPGQSCVIDVTFTPSQKGTRCGNLQVTDNTGTHTVCLSGDGY